MGKVLVIAEKPSVGNDIARVLACSEKRQGYIEGTNYIVTWALGHLIGLKYPEEHEEKFKNWNLEDLPLVFPISNSLKVLSDTSAQFKIIKELIHRDDVESIINAGDAGREGYLIQSWIYRMCGNRKPVKVLWASSMTQEAIEEAMRNLKSDSEFKGLLAEAETRAQGDYLLGINYSRLLTLTRAQGVILSYGRCQTPLLNIIVQRDKEIENFKQTPFYNLQATYRKGFTGMLVSKEKERRDILERSYAEELLQSINGKKAVVNAYETEDKAKKAPLLFNLAELQKVMGAKYKYTPDYTLELCQNLYEKHKLLSYPRTDSRHLSKDLFHVIGKHLECYRFGVFKGLLENMDIAALDCDSRYFNDHKVTDHHAMIPVINHSAEEIYKGLVRDERNVMDAVILSLIAIFYPEYRYKKTEIITAIGDLQFYSQGKTVISLGYKVVLNDMEAKEPEEEKQELLPGLQIGDELTVDKLEIRDKLTQPPHPYTISTLINVMEKYGIGTSATRAEIINKLQNPKRSYIKYEKNNYHSTILGRQLIDVVPEELKDPELTK